MPLRNRKLWLLIIGALLYTLLAYPLYQLYAHRLIEALYRGDLAGIKFRGASFLPLEHYLGQADHFFLRYLWFTPLATLLAWLGMIRLARHLLAIREYAPPADPADRSQLWPHDFLIAGLVYLVLVLAVYHHLLPHLGQEILGPPRDNLKYIWTLWWTGQVLRDPAASLAFSKAIFFPQGANLLYNDYSWYNLLVCLPLRPFLSLPAIYNVLILHSFVLAGLGGFALARHLTRNSLASLASGLVYAFTPSHYAHADLHMNISSIQFLPWFALFFLRALTGGGWRHTWLAGLFLLLTALCDWYYLIFALIFMGLAYGYLAIVQRRLILPGVLGRCGLMLAVTCLPLLPWVLPMMWVSFKEPGVYLGGHFDYVSDLAGFFLPAHFQALSALLPAWLVRVNRVFTGNSNEIACYLGLVNLGLLLYALRHFRGRVAKYLLGLGCMLLLALGPFPHLLGHSLPVALPWLALVKVPFISNVRNPARIMVLAYLFLGVIAALSLDHYLRARPGARQARLVASALIMLTFLEFYSPSIFRTPIELPPVYAHLAPGPEVYGVLDLPGGPQSNKHRYMVYGTMHGRPVVQGALPRQVGTSLKDRLEYRDLAQQKRQLRDNRVKYIVIHKRLIASYDDKRAYEDPNITNVPEYLQTYDLVCEDDGQLLLLVY